jgi:hypothetical protein
MYIDSVETLNYISFYAALIEVWDNLLEVTMRVPTKAA